MALDGTCTSSCDHQIGIGGDTTLGDAFASSSSSSSVTRRPPPASCGNGVLQPDNGEQCDDGPYNGLNGHCDRWCQELFCGNGTVDPGEECEPLRDENNNFMTNSCGQVCAAPTCDVAGTCTGGCRWKILPACSNASSVFSLSPSPYPASQSSSLDDGFVMLTIESGAVLGGESSSYTGLTDSSSGLSVSLFCNDGKIDEGEQCDNGPSNSDMTPDACRTNCAVAHCGDHVVDSNEECDRGTVDNLIGNGCTPICKMSICGDGILQPGEECDDGPRNDDTRPDTCSTRCLMPRCGDSIMDPAFGELCDDGLNNSDTTVDGCRTNCVPAHCGDGVEDSGEQCDAGPLNSDAVADSCRMNCLLPHCGDHVKDAGEQCDDGPRGSTTCSPQCTITAPGFHNAAPLSPDTIPWFFLFLIPITITTMRFFTWAIAP